MKMTKRLFVALLAVLMVMSILPITASAGFFKEGAYSFETADGVATLRFVDDDLVSGAVTIPATTESGFPVVRISDSAFQYCYNITSVTIPEGVTEIGKKSFIKCEKLKTVNLPSTLETIGEEAFSGCAALAKIDIPDSVKSIGGDAFEDTALVKKESNYENGVLYSGKWIISASKAEGTVEIKPGTTSIAGKAFSSSKASRVVIPESMTYISDYAFYFSDIFSVVFPSTLKGIGNHAFSNTHITDFVLPDSLEYIGEYAFGDASLRSIVIPKNCNRIDKNAFYECRLLKKVVILSSPEVISYGTFRTCTSLESITIPKSVKVIEDMAFYSAKIKTVTYSGSEAQWDEIEIGRSNDVLYSADVKFGSKIKVESVFTPTAKVKLEGKVVYGEKGITINEIMDCTESGAYMKDAKGNTILWGDAAVTGLKVILADGTTYTVSIRGDLDGDGEIKAADARLALRASVSLEKLTDAQKKSADMDADGAVKAADARIILRLSVGLPEKDPPKEPEKPKLTISAADYKYLAGNDFRRVRRSYSTARATGGYVYAFVNADGDQCILTVVQYRIQSIYYETTLHNITKGKTITNPEDYYDRLADSSYGANKIHYMDLKGDVLGARVQCLKGISDGLSTGASTGTGVFVPASTLNL